MLAFADKGQNVVTGMIAPATFAENVNAMFAFVGLGQTPEGFFQRVAQVISVAAATVVILEADPKVKTLVQEALIDVVEHVVVLVEARRLPETSASSHASRQCRFVVEAAGEKFYFLE